MKKLVSSDLGGGPITKADLRTIFNDEIWYALESVLASFIGDSQGLIISGAGVVANGGGFDIPSGLVYLNGEFMKIPSFTAQSFPKYIVPDTAVDDTRTFSDGTSHILAVTKSATLSSSIPGAGQYIAITSLTDTDDRKWIPVSSEGAKIRTKIINSGAWNMDTTPQLTAAHGLDYTKILRASAVIYSDAGATTPFNIIFNPVNPPPANQWEAWFPATALSWNSTNIVLTRMDGCVFDSTSYDDGTMNRAKITIDYLA